MGLMTISLLVGSGWASAALLLWQLRRQYYQQYIELRELEARTRELCECYEEHIDMLREKTEVYQTAFDHIRYCRLMIGADADEALSDAITRITGIPPIE